MTYSEHQSWKQLQPLRKVIHKVWMKKHCTTPGKVPKLTSCLTNPSYWNLKTYFAYSHTAHCTVLMTMMNGSVETRASTALSLILKPSLSKAEILFWNLCPWVILTNALQIWSSTSTHPWKGTSMPAAAIPQRWSERQDSSCWIHVYFLHPCSFYHSAWVKQQLEENSIHSSLWRLPFHVCFYGADSFLVSGMYWWQLSCHGHLLPLSSGLHWILRWFIWRQPIWRLRRTDLYQH